MSFAPERILVTGGAGFIGGAFVRHWLDQRADARIVVLDALTYAGGFDNVSDLITDSRIAMVRGDIGDEPLVAALLADHDIDTVVNFAAESHVDRSIAAPRVFLDTNVVGAHVLLHSAATYWLQKRRSRDHRFLQISTDEVYGAVAADATASTEEDPYRPSSPYSASKAAADHMVRAYHRTYGVSTLTVHMSNNFGPRQFPEKLVPRVITSALEGERIPLYGDGLHVRDWMYVGDCCIGVERVLREGAPGERYNFASAISLENHAMVTTLCDIIDTALRGNPELLRAFPRARVALGGTSRDLIELVADRPGHDRRYALDSSKARRAFGLPAPRQFQAALVDTVSWYLENPQWWRARLGVRAPRAQA